MQAAAVDLAGWTLPRLCWGALIAWAMGKARRAGQMLDGYYPKQFSAASNSGLLVS